MDNALRISEQADYIEIIPVKYSHPDSDHYYDKNWLDIHINIKSGVFNGRYSANFQTSDFVLLHEQLEQLYQDLGHEFTFTTLEDQLKIKFKGDGIGHFTLDCTAREHAGMGSTLNFELFIDQTDLPQLLSQLKSINSTFQVLV
jgi:hypothetical protein